jgi:hypothetical protein
VRPAAAMLAICCCMSAAGAQWIEKTIVLPDSLGAFSANGSQVWDSADNKPEGRGVTNLKGR